MATTKFEKPVGSETFELQQQVSTMNTSLNALTTKVGDVGSTDLQTQVNTLNNNLNNLITSRTVEFGDIVICGSGYLNINSYKPSISGYKFIFAFIKGFGTVSSKTAISITSDGNFMVGTAGDTVTNLKVEYFFLAN